ncbi:MAG: hypothetical protein E7633_04235 [Ruminococcaceae bacterium]|nr:hypothetical protein [Oscillospiraceae bacterium]
MFTIKVSNLHWIDNLNQTEDLCLHGNATVTIGDEVWQYDNTTVSSTALYLLKSIKEDHKIYCESSQMLPCCGFTMVANETLSKVDICGCPNGVDWSVLHENDNVVLITETGKRTVIPIDEYRQTVFEFADLIESFYKSSQEKIPEDEFDRNGYIAFWNEWKTLRYEI